MSKRKGSKYQGSKDHRGAAFAHCCKRLYYRYSVADLLEQQALVTEHLRLALEDKVEVLGPRRNGSEVCRVKHKNRDWYFAWNRNWKMMLTYLTEEQAHCNTDLEFLL